jgi:hypothetical protein
MAQAISRCRDAFMMLPSFSQQRQMLKSCSAKAVRELERLEQAGSYFSDPVRSGQASLPWPTKGVQSYFWRAV